MIWIRPRKSELQAKIGDRGQKSEIQPGRLPESEPNRPEKGPEWGLGACTETPRLKAFLNPPKIKSIIGVWKCLGSPPPDPSPILDRIPGPWLQDFCPVLG